MKKYIIPIGILIIGFMIYRMLQTNNVTEPATEYELKPTAEQIHIPIDDDTKLFTRAMHHFTDVNGTEYLTIENTETADDYYYINFYRLDSCKLSHKVKIAKEGPNGIPNMMGHGILDLNHIFIHAFSTPEVYEIDRNGIILNRFSYPTAQNGKMTTPTDFNSLIYKPLIIQDNKLFCMQYPMPPNCTGEQLKQTPLTVIIDTLTQKVETSQLCYPELWSKGDGMGVNPHCSRIFDGERFIYAFRMSHDLLVTKDHIHSEIIPTKSKYIEELQTEGFSRDLEFDTFQKLASEQASYGNILYDKYRKVYYRFVYPKCSIETMNPEYIFCRKEFSIMVLDKNFKILGETLFPAGKYVPALFFINENGLYLSTNNTDNPEMTDDELSFQCFNFQNNNTK